MTGNVTQLKTQNTVTVIDNTNGKRLDLPMMNGTIGPQVFDIRKLYAETGHFSYDPGFT